MESVLPKQLKYESPLSLVGSKVDRFYNPTNGSVFNYNNNGVIRISIPPSNTFINPAQCYLKFTYTNQTVDAAGAAADVHPAGFSPFQTLRILSGSNLLEETNSWNMLATRLVQFQSDSYSRTRMGILANMPIGVDPWGYHTPDPILGAATRTMVIPLISALFTASKFIPLALMSQGLDFEFVLAQPVECVVATNPNDVPNYQISGVQLVVESVTFESEIVNMLKAAIQETGSLSISLQSFLTREAAIGPGAEGVVPIQVSARSVKGFLHVLREQAQRANPELGWGLYSQALVGSYQYQIDGTNVPSQAVTGAVDAFCNTIQVLDTLTNYQGGSAVDLAAYADGTNLFAYNTEMMSDKGIRSGIDLSRSTNPVVIVRAAAAGGFAASILTTWVVCDSELVVSADGSAFVRY